MYENNNITTSHLLGNIIGILQSSLHFKDIECFLMPECECDTLKVYYLSVVSALIMSKRSLWGSKRNSNSSKWSLTLLSSSSYLRQKREHHRQPETHFDYLIDFRDNGMNSGVKLLRLQHWVRILDEPQVATLSTRKRTWIFKCIHFNAACSDLWERNTKEESLKA